MANLKDYLFYQDDWATMSKYKRHKLRKKGIDVPKFPPGPKKGFKRSVEDRLNKSIAARKYLFPMHSILSAQKERIRKSVHYKLWREAVFERDDYTCQKCGDRSGNGHEVYLHSHHIKSFTHFPLLRFAIDNGITYCDKCHGKISKKQMKGNKNGVKRLSVL